MTSDPRRHLGDDAHVVGDQDHRDAGPPLEVAQQGEDLRLHRDVERGGRLVGDQQLRPAGERHGDHHPLALPAGELVRILAEPAGGLGDARPRSRSSIARARGRAARVVGADRLDDLAADAHDRVERGHRLLEDHRDLAAAAAAHLALGQREEVGAAEAAPGRRRRAPSAGAAGP